MKKYADHDIVEKCLLQIEMKLDWGSSNGWHNEVFTELSQLIQRETGVLLSPTTLKRVWGKVNYNHAPSISTLNTLSQFIGFTNWRAFKNTNSEEIKEKLKIKYSTKNSILFISGAVIAILFISLFAMGPGNFGLSKEEYASIKFSSYPVTLGMPNSVVFKFDLDDVDADSIFIQQYWDPTKTIAISKEQKEATGIYYFPGHFKAKLLVDGELVREHNLLIESGGWLATVDYQPVPKYLSESQILNGVLSLPIEMRSVIEKSEEPLYSTFHYLTDLKGISGDNFTLHAEVKNLYRDKWAVCQKTAIYLLGTEGAMIIPFSIAGCVSDIGLMMNEVYLSGKTKDLSMFAADFSTKKTVDIKVENQQLHVSIEGTQVFTGKYENTMGDLVGVRFKFLGAGEVSALSVKNKDGEMKLGLK